MSVHSNSIRFVVLTKAKSHTAAFGVSSVGGTDVSNGNSASIFTVEKYQYYPIIGYKEIRCMLREAFD